MPRRNDKINVSNQAYWIRQADGTGYSPNFARVKLPEGTPRGSIVTVTPKTLEDNLLS